ncbi:MAG: chromate transporter [Coprobacillaceae bacterium]
MKKLLWLFKTNLFISAFVFGGGYVIIPMIKKYYVDKMHYFNEEELLDMAAIAQSSPGAIAINISAVAGYRVAKLKGLIVSCIAAVLPPLVIISIVSVIYLSIKDNQIIMNVLKGMEAGIAALIVDIIISMYGVIIQKKESFYIWITPIVFILNYFFSVNVAILILATAIICALKIKIQEENE